MFESLHTQGHGRPLSGCLRFAPSYNCHIHQCFFFLPSFVRNWYKSFANLIEERNLEQDRIGVDIISDQKIKSTEYLINLIETEFPTYELTNEEKSHWQSGVFSGVLGQSSMSHGTFKDQSVGKWAKKSSKRVTLLDGGLGAVVF